MFNRLFTIPIVVFFGMALPWEELVALGWRGLALVAGGLLFRRLPTILAFRSFVRPLDRRPAILFVGWFGPFGVAAIFYATLSVRQT